MSSFFALSPGVTAMLSLSQKESILRKAGVIVQPFPVRKAPSPDRFDRRHDGYPTATEQADIELEVDVREWKNGVEALYEVWRAGRSDPGRSQGGADAV